MSFITDNMFTILIGGMIILFYFFMKRRSNYFSSRGLPYIAPTWITFFKSFTFKFLFSYPTELYKKKKSEGIPFIGYFQSFLSPVILILDPAMAETVLIKDFSHFVDHGFEFDAEMNPLFEHLFNMNGDKWRTMRHKLLPTFTSGKLKGMTPLLEECADNLISEMKGDNKLRQETNLKDIFRRYTISVIAVCAFGIDPENMKDPNSEFKKHVESLIHPSFLTQLKMALAFNSPQLSRLLKLKLMPQDAEDFFLGLTRNAFEVRKKSGIKRNDFMQLLLELKEKGSVEVDVKELEEDEKNLLNGTNSEVPAAKLELTDAMLSAQAIVFLFAGYENTAYLTALTCYLLSKYPEIQKRIRDEVKSAKSKHGQINYAALKEMKLTGASMDEALRLYSPVQALPRICTKTYTSANGKTIEKGTSLMIPAEAIHYDSQYWPNPEEFNPDRFLNGDPITPATYLPFGDGPRLCIGQRLALIMSKMMVAKIVDNFEILHSSKNKEPLELEIGVTDVKGGFWASFKPLES